MYCVQWNASVLLFQFLVRLTISERSATFVSSLWTASRSKDRQCCIWRSQYKNESSRVKALHLIKSLLLSVDRVFNAFSPKLVGCSPYVQLQGAGAILGGNCGNCRSQVSPGAPSNPSQLYSPAPSSNKSSVTKAAPFWTFVTDPVCWQPAMTVFGSWQKPLRSRDAGTSAVSSQFGFNLTDLMTASDESLTSVK